MSSEWTLNQQNAFSFVIVDVNGNEVSGLGSGYNLSISKNGGAFNVSAGTKSEIGNGWYHYITTAGEADTVGTVSVMVTGSGAVQQNLEYVVVNRSINAREFTYTVDDGINPIEGADVWITTDVGGTNVVYYGVTNTFGILSVSGTLPFLDDGNYYFWTQKTQYVFANPDLETVSALITTGGISGTYVGGAAVLTGSTTSGEVAEYQQVTGAAYARPLPLTLLSLDRYARIMGINPVHFHGAVEHNVFPLDNNNCEDIWAKYSWNRGDSVSLEDISFAIQDAERDIARYLGYWPAPMWFEEEVRPYPKTRHGFSGLYTQDGRHKTLKTKWGKVIRFGKRSLTELELGATVVFTDEDGDTYPETATISVVLPGITVDVRDVKIFFPGASGSPFWEVRPVRHKSVTGGMLTVVVDSWQLIDPAETLPTQWSTFRAIDITGTTTKFVSGLDVYLEGVDSSTQGQFLWSPDGCQWCWGQQVTSCPQCGYSVQDACVVATDVDNGRVAMYPATYDAATTTWSTASPTYAHEPALAKVWYQAGYLSEEYLSWRVDDPLDDYYAKAIAWMATARLDRPLCGCGNLASLGQSLQTDIATSTPDEAAFVNFDLLDNPFGTRAGEIRAWQRLSKLDQALIGAAVV